VAAAAPAAPRGAAAAAAAAAPAGDAARGFTDVPHSSVRATIARRLVASKATVPHYFLTVDVTLDALLALRTRLNAALGEGAAKVSVNDCLVKAAAAALRKVPQVNSSWFDDGFIRAYDYVDVSVAVAAPDGLVTPVVRDADKKGLGAVAAEVRALVDKAHAKKLSLADMSGGTFTISNLGMFGVKQFAAIINPPQAAILAVGAATARVVPAEGGGVKQALVASMTLSCDHRVVDGAVGAQWLQAFKALVEAPETMLL
jgi:pyruvate dehydrogenase E2 component (dihydrolipoamide acetyltransferase)